MKTKDVLLSLQGLRMGSPQGMGAIRMIPLLRDAPPGDLRIGVRHFKSQVGYVGLDSRPEEPGLKYTAYVPHGFVISYTDDGTTASLGASLGDDERPGFVKLHHRMVKSEEGEGSTQRFRMLPLHLALEGYLAFHFNAPQIVWNEYSEHARRFGLDPRSERAVVGEWLYGFERAVATFEMHPNQVGVLVFVAEALATVFVLSHPDDYRRAHATMLEDFFGELLQQYAYFYDELPRTEAPLNVDAVTDLASLVRETERVRSEWRAYGDLLTRGLFEREVRIDVVRDTRRFELQRFMPKFDPNEECHIGERIVRADGTLEYMKTFRLSQAQIRRGYLLQRLAEADWNLEEASKLLGCGLSDLLTRLVNAGFGYLLKPHLVRGLPKQYAPHV